MSTIIQNTASAPLATVGARKIDPSRGSSDGSISTQWLSRPRDQRFLRLSDLRAHVRRRRDASRERRIDQRKIEFIAPPPKTIADIHKMTVGYTAGGEVAEVAATHWSFGQLAREAGAPAGYLRTLPSNIVADAMAFGLRYNRPEKELKLYHDEGTLHAATGPEYGRVFDEEVVEAIMQIAGEGTGDEAWKIPGVMDWRTHIYDPHAPVTIDSTTLYASERDVFIFLVDDTHPIEIGKLPDGSPDYVFRGFYVSNSEFGNGALKIRCFYLRGICCNRILWGVERFEELSINHTKGAPARFLEEARPALTSFANGSEKTFLDGVAKAREAKIAETQDEALAFLQARDFSRKASLAIWETHEREEGRPMTSAWDFAQGITAYARDVPNNDDRVDVEAIAGKILDKVA